MDLSDRLQTFSPVGFSPAGFSPTGSTYSPVPVGSPPIGTPPTGGVGVGTPDFDADAFLATVQALPTPPPLVASPAGQGTNILDYTNRDDVIKAVSTALKVGRSLAKGAGMKMIKSVARGAAGAAGNFATQKLLQKVFNRKKKPQ